MACGFLDTGSSETVMWCCADTVPARNDFVCMIGCVSGRDAVLALGGNQTNAKALNASYFSPPYQINKVDNVYNIS